MAVTVRDVAAEAGVSFQLVAAVLGGKKYAHASASTREKIQETARKLGYVPNASARILRGDASRIIGVLIDSRAPESMYGVLAEIEQHADELGYRILSAQAHDNPNKLLQAYYSLKQNGVDGIISFSHDYSQLDCRLDQRLKDDPKIVFVLNTDEQNPSAVDVDIKSGILAAAEHLRRQGYRKTALLLHGNSDPGKQPLSCKKRLEGFRLGCPDGEVFFLPTLNADLIALEKGTRDLVREKLIPGGFDSAIAVNDLLAVILMNQLSLAGIRIPQDFGVVGCDNLPIGACYPVKLTTLHYDRKDIARNVLTILQDKISGKSSPVRINIPVELIVRASTDKNSRKEGA
ncbi:MAG: LacI family DNA-binding transcriptional regulator [Lentisphaeria bacterium]|nr:LacI family DNA-binding transcriptional regulator [Lentisphaeria bacterium]